MAPGIAALSTLLATFFGVGRIPFAQGSVASLIALPLGWLLMGFGWPGLLAGAILATMLGVWACGVYARNARIYDPPECVIDEVAGQWFALLPIAVVMHPSNRLAFFIAFILFRWFDIVKPWPVSTLERLPGGFGVMMDDVLAGLIVAGLVYGALVAGLI